MKKLIPILLTAVLLLGLLCGCSSDKNTDRLEQIKQRGYIEVFTEPYFAPNEFIDPSLP